MMEIPAGKWCNEESQCAFFCDACLFSEDQAEEPVLVRVNDEEGYVDAFERSPACLAAYPNGATIEIKPKEVHR